MEVPSPLESNEEIMSVIVNDTYVMLCDTITKVKDDLEFECYFKAAMFFVISGYLLLFYLKITNGEF
jgi:hypothetical protein